MCGSEALESAVPLDANRAVPFAFGLVKQASVEHLQDHSALFAHLDEVEAEGEGEDEGEGYNDGLNGQ